MRHSPFGQVRVPSGLVVRSTKRSLIESNVSPELLPSTYRQNHFKEDALIECAEMFRRDFVRLYPDRRPLVLSPLNEAGQRKFLSTSIRPTALPCQREFDWTHCAQLVADLFTYLALDDPSCLPDFVPSSTFALQVRSGDCLDMSLMLCSLLRGYGYDAYVVMGVAEKWVATNDSSQTKCPLLPDAESEAANATREKKRKEAEEIKRNRYLTFIRDHPQHTSTFEQKQSKNEASYGNSASKEPITASLTINSKVLPQSHQKYAHSWVLVRKGRRDVTEPAFIESSSGQVIPMSQSGKAYLEVDAIFNDHNYWVNIQTLASVDVLNVDVDDQEAWEPVLSLKPTVVPAELKEEKEQFGNNNSSVLNTTSHVSSSISASEHKRAIAVQWLDVPASWLAPIIITREQRQKRFPLGFKAINYHRCLVEKWSPYTESERGVVQRITLYEDDDKQNIREIQELYAHRVDKLVTRVIQPSLKRIRSDFAPGLTSGLKSIITMYGISREMTFIPGSRVDGLILRVELMGKKVIERYSAREDRLIYRSLTVDLAAANAANPSLRAKSFMVAIGGGLELPISKLAERFSPDPGTNPEEDVVKRTHMLNEAVIRLDFACIPGALEGSQMIIDKSDKLENGEVEAKSAQSRGYIRRRTRGYKEKSRGEEQRTVAKLLVTEKELKVKIKEREQRFALMLNELNELDDKAKLAVDLYDRAHAAALTSNEQATLIQNVPSGLENRGALQVSTDYLAPFLTSLDVKVPLNKHQCEAVKSACLTSLKERLFSRASIIQSHLEDEQAKLASKQAALKRAAGSGSMEASEEFQQFSRQCLFRIDILMARKSRHEATALKRYEALEIQLMNDVRLAALSH